MGSVFIETQRFLFSLIALFFAVSAYAEIGGDARFNPSYLKMQLPTLDDARIGTGFHFRVNAEEESFGTSAARTEQYNQYFRLTPSMRYSYLTDRSQFDANALAVLPGSSGVAPQLAVPELFFKFKPSNNGSSFAVGRMKQNWSTLDDHGNLGLWQPLARWDAVRPISQGLTGFFVKYNAEKFRLTYFATPIFLPDQGPEFDIKNGAVTSSNRWFRPPVDQAQVQNSEASIRYSLDTPSVSSVVNHPGQAVMVEIGPEDEGLFLHLAMAKMPVNQYHLGLDSHYITSNELTAVIHPYVIDHQLITAESGYRYSTGQFTISNTWEKFDHPKLPDSYQQSEIIDSQYLGAVVAQDLSLFGLKKAALDLSYVQRIKSAAAAKDNFTVGSVESSSQRLSFDKLFGVEFKKNVFKTYANGLDISLGYFYSITDEGEWLHGDISYLYEQNWVWNISGDVFGASGAIDENASFISKFRGNDRMMGGFSYVF